MPSRSNEKERSELKGGFRGNVDVNGCINALAFLYQRSGLHNGRLPQNCIGQVRYQVGLRMQFFAGDADRMTTLTRRIFDFRVSGLHYDFALEGSRCNAWQKKGRAVLSVLSFLFLADAALSRESRKLLPLGGLLANCAEVSEERCET